MSKRKREGDDIPSEQPKRKIKRDSEIERKNQEWRIWYIKENSNTFTDNDDCLVVALLNCYYYLMLKHNKSFSTIKPESELYKYLYENKHIIPRVVKKLGMKIVETYDTIFDLQYLNDGKQYPRRNIELPLLVPTFDKYHGTHACAIIDYEPLTRSYRIPNFKQTNMDGWIYSEDFHTFARKAHEKFYLLGLSE